jgi:8-hydroxy-5-deazaflavin:NADPH oxidoreductase
MKAAVLGTGSVGQTIATRLAGLGHQVVMGTRDVAESKLRKTADAFGNPAIGEWVEKNPSVKLVTFKEAAAFGEIVFNCTKGVYGIEALTLAGKENLAGKIIVDISNPLDFSKGMPPTLTISNDNSLGEEIQKQFPNAKVVKALNTMWCGLMVNPAMINGGDHSTFVCGNDQDAKVQVKTILKSFGWAEKNILDLGDITNSRGTEMYLPLWVRVFGVTQNGAFNIKIVS